jgi:hypothetical protein
MTMDSYVEVHAYKLHTCATLISTSLYREQARLQARRTSWSQLRNGIVLTDWSPLWVPDQVRCDIHRDSSHVSEMPVMFQTLRDCPQLWLGGVEVLTMWNSCDWHFLIMFNDDQEASRCQSCERPFTVLRRKHHCRCCGHVVCDACSQNRPRSKRVCDTCMSSTVPSTNSNVNITPDKNHAVDEVSASVRDMPTVSEWISRDLGVKVKRKFKVPDFTAETCQSWKRSC